MKTAAGISVTQEARELVAAVVRSSHLRGETGDEEREMCDPETQDEALTYIASLEADSRRLVALELVTETVVENASWNGTTYTVPWDDMQKLVDATLTKPRRHSAELSRRAVTEPATPKEK